MYNPKKFISDNIKFILSESKNEVKSITFSGYIKKHFHTGNRPFGFVEITYSDQFDTIHTKKLFLKHHKDSFKAFNLINKVYTNIEDQAIRSKIPKPILCDFENNAMFFQNINGVPLNQHIFRNLIFNRSKKVDNYANVISGIGSWLSEFHETTKTNKIISLSVIQENLLKSIRNTQYFNNLERDKITSLLSECVKNIKNNKALNIVRTHNDFNLRNVIFSKNDFYVIDWDAMIHKDFERSCLWIDVTKFSISLKSLSRFKPYISRNINEKFLESFLEGYFGDIYRDNKTEYESLLWLFTLSFYLGLIGDRSLPEIFHNKIGQYYVARIKNNLLEGSSQITSIA